MRTPPESAKPDSWGERALEAGWAASAVSVMGLGGHAALHGPDGLGGELLPVDRPVAALRLLDVHTQVTPRMLSPSMSTIASVSFSIISRFSSESKTPSMSLTLMMGMDPPRGSSWSFDRPNVMLGCRGVKRNRSTRRPRPGDPAEDPRRGAPDAGRARRRRHEHALGGGAGRRPALARPL